jgi:D-lactate dehydrogenase
MKIVAFEAEEWEHAARLRLEAQHSVVCTQAALTEEAASQHADAEIVTTFINSTLDRSVIARLPNLRLIATRSTGYDHIDLAYCRSRGIVVSNVPDYGDSTVAEHAFALLLAVARNLVDSVERTRRGNFMQTGLRGFELRGKVLGVIGTGRIGRRVIEIARGFGMHVIAFDVQADAATAQGLGFRYVTFESLLSSADIITLHVPAMPDTVGLLSDRAFSLVKPGLILINTARGNVIDIPALVRALTDERVKAAGLDVLPQEPLIREEAQIFRTNSSDHYDLKALVANHVLLRFPNVIVTPHNAYNTDSAVRRIIDTTIANIEAFARGKPQNVISGGPSSAAVAAL